MAAMPRRWGMFALLFAARTAMAFQFQSVAAAGPYLIKALSIDFALLGVLIGCHMLPGIVLALPSGLLGERLGSKRTVMLALVLMAVGGALTMADTTAFVFAGRILSGIGAVTLNVQLTDMVAAWFPAGEIVAVMGAFVASWPLGIALALISLPAVAGTFGLAIAMLAAALPSALCLILMATWYRDPPRLWAHTGRDLRIDFSAAVLTRICLAGVIWGLYNASYVVFVTALPSVLQRRGLNLEDASAFTSLFGWVLMVTLPLGGFIAQRSRRATLTMVASFAVVIAAALSLVWTHATATSLAVLAIAIGLPAGTIMALPSSMLTPERRARGFGVFFSVFYIAMATLPGLAGAARDATGNAGAPILVGAAMLALATLAVAVLSAIESHAGRRMAAP